MNRLISTLAATTRPRPKHPPKGRHRARATRPSVESLEGLIMLSNATATFVGSDTTTAGNWIGNYGSQGYDIIGEGASYPAYAQVTPVGESTCVWTPSTSAPQALQTIGGTSRLAACWFGSSFSVDVNLTDGQSHDLALYALDWDAAGRSEQIQITNAATGAVLDTRAISSFSGGEYLQWAATGNVVVNVTCTGGPNAVISGLFFDPKSTTTATFVGSDTTTAGNWIGNYGSQGYDIIGEGASYPAYAQVTPVGESTCVWTPSTSAPQALQTIGGTSRLAACWFGSSFSVDVNLTDGQSHDLALYALDWDAAGRSEQIQITNAATGNLLDTETISSFSGGEYLQWAVSGDVVVNVTCTGGPNAVISGLFFDPNSTPTPTPTPAPNPGAVTSANWSGYVAADQSFRAASEFGDRRSAVRGSFRR